MMWRSGRGQRPAESGNQLLPGSRPRAKRLTSQQNRIISLGQDGRYRTALDEILRGLRQNPDDAFLLKVAVPIAGASRTANLDAAEPATPAQTASALLAAIAAECSSCGTVWYSKHRPDEKGTAIHRPPAGLQCQTCRYTLCRDCLGTTKMSPSDRIDAPVLILGPCPKGHGLLETPVLPTGRSDVIAVRPERIEAVIVTRDGPIPPTMAEALDVVPRFVPLIADDAALIHIRPSKPGAMAERSGREELTLAQVRELEREGVLAPGAAERARCVFAEVSNGAVGKYLVAVVSKATDSDPGKPIATAPASDIIDRVLAAAKDLPVARPEDIQYDFDFAGPKWGSRKILILTDRQLRRRLKAVCKADAASGCSIFGMSTSEEESPHGPLPYVQLNTLSSTRLAFRPYRITRRADGRYAVYGHAALYNV
jgi:hypothetical protein